MLAGVKVNRVTTSCYWLSHRVGKMTNKSVEDYDLNSFGPRNLYQALQEVAQGARNYYLWNVDCQPNLHLLRCCGHLCLMTTKMTCLTSTLLKDWAMPACLPETHHNPILLPHEAHSCGTQAST